MAAGTHETAVRAFEEQTGITRADNERMLIRVESVGRNRIGLTAASRWRWVRCGIPTHVVPSTASIRRVEHGPAIGFADVLAVLVGATQIDEVGIPSGCDDKVVVPTLPSAIIIHMRSTQ